MSTYCLVSLTFDLWQSEKMTSSGDNCHVEYGISWHLYNELFSYVSRCLVFRLTRQSKPTRFVYSREFVQCFGRSVSCLNLSHNKLSFLKAIRQSICAIISQVGRIFFYQVQRWTYRTLLYNLFSPSLLELDISGLVQKWVSWPQMGQLWYETI